MSMHTLSVSTAAEFVKESQHAPLSRPSSSSPVSFVTELGNNRPSIKATRTRVADSKASGLPDTMQQDSATQLQDDKEFEKTLDYKLVLRVQKGDKKAFDLLVIK